MKKILLKIWITILATMRTPLHPLRRKRSEVRQRALTNALFVFGFSMEMGRVAAPLVIAILFGSVEHPAEIQVFVLCCLSAGTIVCGLLGWVTYRLSIRSGLRDEREWRRRLKTLATDRH